MLLSIYVGDMGIAVPTAFVSTNDLIPVKNALSTMFAAINPSTGALPESGPPLSQLDSDTYHGWTLIGTYNYYLYSGDDVWLKEVWANYVCSFLLFSRCIISKRKYYAHINSYRQKPYSS